MRKDQCRHRRLAAHELSVFFSIHISILLVLLINLKSLKLKLCYLYKSSIIYFRHFVGLNVKDC